MRILDLSHGAPNDYSTPSSKHVKRGMVAFLLATSFGQLVFTAYIVVAFGVPALAGNFEAWNERFESAYVEGATAANLLVGSHLSSSALLLLLAPIQIFTGVKRKWMRFHKITGVVVLAAATAASHTGLAMLFTKDIGSLALKAGFLMQSLLVIGCAAMLARSVIRRVFTHHGRWAIRLYISSSIALHYRVIFVLWFALTGGAGINTEVGEGFFLDFMAVGQLIPLLVVELGFCALSSPSTLKARVFSSLLWIGAVGTFAGVAFMAVGSWFGSAVG